MNPCLALTAARHEARQLDPSRANDYAYFLEPANSHDSVDVVEQADLEGLFDHGPGQFFLLVVLGGDGDDLEGGRSPKAVEEWGRRAPHWRKDGWMYSERLCLAKMQYSASYLIPHILSIKLDLTIISSI